MKERQNSLNPFLPTQKYPNRHNPSQFMKLHKVKPKRKRTVKATQKKAKRIYTPSIWVTFTTQPKAVDSVQAWQTETLFTVMKLIMTALTNQNMTPAVPSLPIPVTSQKRPTYCAMCTVLGRLWPTFLPLTTSLPHPNWLDSEEEDWDGERQKEKE